MNRKYYIGNWYEPGSWELPKWWTEGPPGKDGRLTHEEQIVFYNSKFCKETLKHDGGITKCPQVIKPS